MSNNSNNTQFKSPTDIARETFRQLAIQRIAPTPDAYKKLYNEIAGIFVLPDEPTTITKPVTVKVSTPSEAETLLASFASSLLNSKSELSNFGHRFNRAARNGNWEDYSKALEQLTERIIATQSSVTANTPQSLSLADPLTASTQQNNSVISLVDVPVIEDPRPKLLKDLLFRTLTLALTSVLKPTSPTLAIESEALGKAVKEAETENALNQVASRLKQLCFQIELQSGDSAEQQELLLRLFGLLLTNIHDLLDNDNWLRGQIEVVQNLIAGPINHRSLQEATRSLKEVIYKQGTLKNSIAESKNSVKNMMNAFVDRLNAMVNTTDTYQHKMDDFASEISHATDTAQVSKIINNIIGETRAVQSEAVKSRDIIVAAQKEVMEAEIKIKDLESKLAHMSELVREDQLTGSLNRRGMDDIFEREADRADRRNSPMCVAMLDLDNFKRLNDTHGHAAGDEALVHLVRIVKQTLRSIDTIARYGGEEFVIIMPETDIEEAAQAMTRVQRELTKHFFTSDLKRLFITFSAGVALRGPREPQEALIKRADKAMYAAKHAGKNRVVKAD